MTASATADRIVTTERLTGAARLAELAAIKANPKRARFWYGRKAALVNIDFQCAYTRLDEFKTAYETDPRQIEYVNALARRFRALKWPVVWTHVAYAESGEDAGVWGTRTDTPDSLQNIKHGSRRAQLDIRCEIDRSHDLIYCKRMPSPAWSCRGRCGLRCRRSCCVARSTQERSKTRM